MTFDYADSPHPVRSDLVEAHRRAWDRLAGAGTWLVGAQRVAIMAETRNARGCAFCNEIRNALSPFAVQGVHDSLGELPDNWVDMIHRIVADPGRLTRSWYDQTLASGISDAEFVEIVSVVAHVTAVDTFAKGLGVPLRPLPEPRDGAPSRYRPAEARQHQAWAPNIALNKPATPAASTAPSPPTAFASARRAASSRAASSPMTASAKAINRSPAGTPVSPAPAPPVTAL